MDNENLVFMPEVDTLSKPVKYQSIETNNKPLAIDFGTYEIKAGVDNNDPLLRMPNLIAKVRDRNNSVTYSVIGNDLYLNSSFIKDAKSPFTEGFISNWEYTELIMDSIIGNLFKNGNEHPILLNEPLFQFKNQRSNWYELMFESYQGVNQLSLGVDSLFSYYNLRNQNETKNGLIVNIGHSSTNIIPFIKNVPDLENCQKLDITGDALTKYLSRSLFLKYNLNFTDQQIEKLFHDHAYVAKDYSKEVNDILQNVEYLKGRDVTVQLDYKEPEVVVKSEEQLRIEHEKKIKSGIRLQEQAKIKREQKLLEKQNDYLYYTTLLENEWKDLSKVELVRALENSGFDDEADFKKYMKSLEASIARANKEDDDEEDNEDDLQPPEITLIDVPDEELSPEDLKKKRMQKLQLAGFKARQQNKLEKKAREEEKQRLIDLDNKWREQDLKSWLKDKHEKLNKLLQSRKEKIQLKKELKDRKSAINQQKMKNLTSLVDETENDKKEGVNKRNRLAVTLDNDPNDTFGANDNDWDIYNKKILDDPAKIDELMELEFKEIVKLEDMLLQYDINFLKEHTLDYKVQNSWKKSIMHRFLRGPNKFNDTLKEHNQIHLNVERFKTPEVLFYPHIAGSQYLGISDVCRDLISGGKNARLSNDQLEMCQNIYLTGGVSKIPGIKQRIVADFESWLPTGTNVNVKQSDTPDLDCYNGMIKYSKSEEYSRSVISKEEYRENGPEYIKEHLLGNTIEKE